MAKTNTVRKLYEDKQQPKAQGKASPSSAGYAHVDALKQYLETTPGASKALISRRLGISAAKLSLYLDRQYPVSEGKLIELDQRVAGFLQREATRGKIQERLFFETTHARLAMRFLDVCFNFQKMRILKAGTGLGKTWAFEQYKTEHDNVLLLTCDATRRSQRALVEMLHSSVFKEPFSRRKPLRDGLDAITEKIKNRDMLIIIDESQNLWFDALELLRTLYDATGVGMLLGDTADMLDAPGFDRTKQYERNPQIMRRTGQELVLPLEISDGDVQPFLTHFGVDNLKVIAWLMERVNFPNTRYQWLSETLQGVNQMAMGDKHKLNSLRYYEVYQAKMTGEI